MWHAMLEQVCLEKTSLHAQKQRKICEKVQKHTVGNIDHFWHENLKKRQKFKKSNFFGRKFQLNPDFNMSQKLSILPTQQQYQDDHITSMWLMSETVPEQSWT